MAVSETLLRQCHMHATLILHVLDGGHWRRDEEWRRTVLRTMATEIFEIRGNMSGLISKAAKDAWHSGRLTKGKLCKEHYHPRQTSAMNILSLYEEGGLTIDKLVDVLLQVTKTHLVLPEENIRLSQIQNSREHWGKGWELHYQVAGIELIPDDERKPSENKVDILINGVVYSPKEVAEKYNISIESVYCRLRTKKWREAGWERKQAA